MADLLKDAEGAIGNQSGGGGHSENTIGSGGGGGGGGGDHAIDQGVNQGMPPSYSAPLTLWND